MTRSLAVFALIATLVIARAEAAPVPSGDRLVAVAAALVAEPGRAEATLDALFAPVAGDPEAAAALALALLERLEGEPLAVAELADAVYRTATRAMAALPVYRLVVDPAFSLPPSHLGWDLGPPESALAPGFAAAAPEQIVAAGPLGGLADGDPLVGDALVGLAGFRARVPDGSYRLIVLTRPGPSEAPLGGGLGVNGVPLRLARATPESWVERAYLMPPALQQAGDAGRRLGAVGGAVATTVDVIGGRLAIDFEAPRGAVVAAVILEPLGAPTVFVAPDARADEARVLAAESAIAREVGRLFEAVASAAGEEALPALLRDLPAPPVDPQRYRSPS